MRQSQVENEHYIRSNVRFLAHIQLNFEHYTNLCTYLFRTEQVISNTNIREVPGVKSNSLWYTRIIMLYIHVCCVCVHSAGFISGYNMYVHTYIGIEPIKIIIYNTLLDQIP